LKYEETLPLQKEQIQIPKRKSKGIDGEFTKVYIPLKIDRQIDR
jgi:hypothetical protein